MLSFINFIESKVFSSLIPQNVRSSIGKIEQELKKLTDNYAKDNKQRIDYKFCELPDTFSDKPIKVFFVDAGTWNEKGMNGAGVAWQSPDNFIVAYKVPMTSLDTVYHELVHAYDPKLRKGLSKPQSSGGMQNNLTPHEVDARLSGVIHIAKQKLQNMQPEERKKTLDEFKDFLRAAPETDSYLLPSLLNGLYLDAYRRDKKMWRKVLTTIYHGILAN